MELKLSMGYTSSTENTYQLNMRKDYHRPIAIFQHSIQSHHMFVGLLNVYMAGTIYPDKNRSGSILMEISNATKMADKCVGSNVIQHSVKH